MKMYFEHDEMVTIRYMMKSWKVKKSYIADYLTGQFDENNDFNKESILERVIVLVQLPFINSFEVSPEKENIITIYPIATRMEVSSKLYNFLISR